MNDTDLLRCLISVIGRVAMPTETVRSIIGKGRNRIKAFNLCDGSNTLGEIARKVRIDKGNLSRAAADWVEHGIAFWIGEENEARLLHIYPVPEKDSTRRRASAAK